MHVSIISIIFVGTWEETKASTQEDVKQTQKTAPERKRKIRETTFIRKKSKERRNRIEPKKNVEIAWKSKYEEKKKNFKFHLTLKYVFRKNDKQC